MPRPMPRPPPVTSATPGPRAQLPLHVDRMCANLARCTRAAARRSSPRSSPTSASPSPSSSASCITGSAGLLAEADALPRRHRQPGPAVPRRHRAKRERRRRSTRSATGASATSGLRRRARAVQHGRPVRHLRGHREAAPPARDREPRRRRRHPRRRHGAGELSLRTAVQRVATRASRRRSRGGAFIRRTQAPELPVVLLEDIGALRRPGLRPHRRDARRHHRQPPLGRRRLASPSACCWSSSPSCSASR